MVQQGTDQTSSWYSANRESWESELRHWLLETANAQNLGQIEEISVIKERPWSLVWLVRFEDATCYFKACASRGRHELELLAFLAKRATFNLPPVVASDPIQGWLLVADVGIPLRNTAPEFNQLALLERALTDYANLQIASLNWTDELLALGLPDRRLERLPTLLTELLASDVLRINRADAEVSALRRAAAERMHEFEHICAELATSPYANALDHGDFHAGNLIVQEQSQANDYTVIDWGDACITHPFCSVLVTWEAVQKLIPQGQETMWRERMRNAYLAPWAAHFPEAQLILDYERAQWVAQVGRALDLDYMFYGGDEASLNQWRPMIFKQLQQWLEGCV